jgi:hypothetical protein
MHLLTLLSAFSANPGLALASCAGRSSPPSRITPKPLALLHTYPYAQDCATDTAAYCQLPIYESATCIAFPEGTEMLRVVASDRDKLRYNSREFLLDMLTIGMY